MTTFIFEPCHASTKILIDALAAKAKQGVKVRVLLDGFMQKSEHKGALAIYFAKRGIDFKLFSDFPLANSRTHIKLMVVDGVSSIIGGRNLSDDYFSLAEGVNFLDREVLIRGPSGREAQDLFNELWNSPMNSRPAPASDEALRTVCLKKNPFDQKVAAYFKEKSASLIAAIPARTCSRVEIVTDHPDFMNPTYSEEGGEYLNDIRLRLKRTTKAHLDFFAGTRRALEIENWSYLPSGRIDQTLEDLRRRNVRLQILTNGSAGAGGVFDGFFDILQKQYSIRDTRGSSAVIQISRQGAMNDRFQLTPARASWKIHSKVAVRDGRDVLVGSFNLDPRSYHTNLETAALFENCPELAQDLKAQFENLKRVYRQDLSCQKCQQDIEPSLFGQILGWMGHEFL